MRADLAGRPRAICLALPEVNQRLSRGALTWFARYKSAFVTHGVITCGMATGGCRNSGAFGIAAGSIEA